MKECIPEYDDLFRFPFPWASVEVQQKLSEIDERYITDSIVSTKQILAIHFNKTRYLEANELFTIDNQSEVSNLTIQITYYHNFPTKIG